MTVLLVLENERSAIMGQSLAAL